MEIFKQQGAGRVFWSLIRKEFLVTIRSFDRFFASLFIALLVTLMIVFGISGAFLSPRQVRSITPTMLWVLIFGLSSLLGERMLEPDLRHKAYEAIVLSGVNLRLVFLSKVILQTFSIVLHAFLVCGVIEGTLGVRAFQGLTESWWIFLVSIVSFSSLAILAGSVSAVSRLKGILFPIIVLPNSFPLFLACLELTYPVFVEGGQVAASGGWSSVLLLSFLFHIGLGLFLYPFLMKS
jgi:ABC-type transport system involved in cytochrome c biogenesis permease component